MKIFITITTFFFLPAVLLAQEEDSKNRSIGISWGISHVGRQDLIFSPFIHKAESPLDIGIVYRKQKKLMQMADLNFTMFRPSYAGTYDFLEHGELKTAEKGVFTFVNLNYFLSKNIHQTTRMKLHLGAGIMGKVETLDYVYGRIGNFGYLSTLGLAVSMANEYRLSENQSISLQIRFPLVSWLARSPYAINDDEYIENTQSHHAINSFFSLISDGQLATWDQLQYGNLEFGYHILLKTRWSMGIKYHLSALHSTLPRNLLSIQNGIKLTADIKI